MTQRHHHINILSVVICIYCSLQYEILYASSLFQGVEIIRGCRGLNLVGCDLVEVSPPYDTTGTGNSSLLIKILIFNNPHLHFYCPHQETLRWLVPTSSLKCCASSPKSNITDWKKHGQKVSTRLISARCNLHGCIKGVNHKLHQHPSAPANSNTFYHVD